MSETAGRRKRGRPKGSTARMFSRTYYLRQAVNEIRAIRDRKGEVYVVRAFRTVGLAI